MKKVLVLVMLLFLVGCDTETVQNRGIDFDEATTEEREELLSSYDIAIAEITNVEQGDDLYTYSICVIDRTDDCGDIESEKIYKDVGDYVIIAEIEESYVIIVD